MINLEQTIIRKLKATQHVICTIESCTGGLIAHLLTNVAGASEVYWGSFIVYDNTAKEDFGIQKEILSSYGAVSKEIASALAELGIRKIQTSTLQHSSHSLIKPRGLISIATTGIAGPGGGTREKPVGLCFIGLAITGKTTLVEEFHAPDPGDRIQMKTQFAQKALEMIRGHV